MLDDISEVRHSQPQTPRIQNGFESQKTGDDRQSEFAYFDTFGKGSGFASDAIRSESGRNSGQGSQSASGEMSGPQNVPNRAANGFDELSTEWPEDCDSGDSLLDTNTAKSLIQSPEGLTAEIELLRKVREATRYKTFTKALPLALRVRDGKCYSRVAGRIEGCSTYLRFREYFEGSVFLKSANFCNMHRLCPWCAKRRALKLLQHHMERLVPILDRGGLVPCLVTMTVKNGINLRERVNHLSKGLHKASVRRRNAREGGQGKFSEFGRIEAAVWHFEVSRNQQTKEWHPHVHGLCLRPESQMFNATNMRSEWHDITKDSNVVDIKLLQSVRAIWADGMTLADGLKHQRHRSKLVGDLCEVFKYPLKFQGLSPEECIDVYEATKGLRWLREWGTDFKTVEPENLADDVSKLGQLYRNHVFHWIEGTSSYGSRSVSDWEIEDGGY